MTRFNFAGFEVVVNATFKESVFNVWGDKMTHNKFVVTIRTNAGNTRFTFYDSFANYQQGKTEPDTEDLKEMLECYLMDASCYDCSRDFVDFCNEMGYSSMNDYHKAKKAFEGCKRHYEGAKRLFGENWYDVANAINE